MRLNPGECPQILPEDIILKDGDILYVDSRDTDIYYTGGLLGGGEWLLPRDYDLDVVGAVALAGVNVGVGRQQSGLVGAAGSVEPTELIVLRPLPGRRQIAIRVNLNEAVNDPQKRLLVRAGDTLILRYRPSEELINFASSVFFTFGIRELFRNR
jgi:hypothetical protein